MYTALPSQVQHSRSDDEGSDAGVEVPRAKRDNGTSLSAACFERREDIRVTQIQVPCIDNDSAQPQGLSGFVEDDLLQYPDTWCDAHDAKVVIHVVVTERSACAAMLCPLLLVCREQLLPPRQTRSRLPRRRCRRLPVFSLASIRCLDRISLFAKLTVSVRLRPSVIQLLCWVCWPPQTASCWSVAMSSAFLFPCGRVVKQMKCYHHWRARYITRESAQDEGACLCLSGR